MYNISFKASFEGMNSEVLKVIFERRTANDKKHKVVFKENPDKYGEDKFELYNKDKKTAEYTTEINPRLFSIERLMGIYNILRAKEAQAKIEAMREEMRNKK